MPFPFSDLTASKKRSALIVSSNEYNIYLDVVIAFMTSKLDVESKPGDYLIRNWKSANLPKPSMVRMKFATIDKSVIVKKLGKLGRRDIDGFRTEMVNFFSK